jgi:hypothetical protein
MAAPEISTDGPLPLAATVALRRLRDCRYNNLSLTFGHQTQTAEMTANEGRNQRCLTGERS